MNKQEILQQLEERLPDWYHPNRLMLLTLVGSRGYRLHTDQSDYDFFAVVMPPLKHIIGTGDWESYTAQTDYFDLKVYSVRKYMHMCMKGSVNSLEPLFMTPLVCSPWMDPWIRSASKFVTKSTVNSILGYTTSMLKRYTDLEGSDQGQKRRRLIETYGYDTSAAAHCIRWLWMGWEMYFNKATGLVPDMEESPMREVVMRIKRGDMPIEELEQLIIRYRDPLEENADELRERLGPLDEKHANQILTTLHLSGLGL